MFVMCLLELTNLVQRKILDTILNYRQERDIELKSFVFEIARMLYLY